MEYSMSDIDIVLQKIKASSYAVLPDIIEEIPLAVRENVMAEVCRCLEAEAERWIRMAVYIDQIVYWQKDHESAIKKQNSVGAQIRKALGYSYPKRNKVTW